MFFAHMSSSRSTSIRECLPLIVTSAYDTATSKEAAAFIEACVQERTTADSIPPAIVAQQMQVLQAALSPEQ
jgi:hypothetical protein